MLHPLLVGSAPLLWRYSRRREHRRACIQLVRHQRASDEPVAANCRFAPTAQVVLSLSQRAHYRLSWQERLARNARTETAGQLTLKLFGLPKGFASWLGLTGA